VSVVSGQWLVSPIRNWWWKLLSGNELSQVGRIGRVASPRRPIFYGEVASPGLLMLTVRSEIGPYRRLITWPSRE
jgi:hypothetical protein